MSKSDSMMKSQCVSDMMKNVVGSMENVIRYAYNNGYKDAKAEGCSDKDEMLRMVFDSDEGWSLTVTKDARSSKPKRDMGGMDSAGSWISGYSSSVAVRMKPKSEASPVTVTRKNRLSALLSGTQNMQRLLLNASLKWLISLRKSRTSRNLSISPVMIGKR